MWVTLYALSLTGLVRTHSLRFLSSTGDLAIYKRKIKIKQSVWSQFVMAQQFVDRPSSQACLRPRQTALHLQWRADLGALNLVESFTSPSRQIQGLYRVSLNKRFSLGKLIIKRALCIWIPYGNRSLLLYDIATRSSTFPQDCWTQTHQIQWCLPCSYVIICS